MMKWWRRRRPRPPWLLVWCLFFLTGVSLSASAPQDDNVDGDLRSFSCPPLVCTCSDLTLAANCSRRGLLKAPPGLPLTLVRLDLSHNELTSINTSEVMRLVDLEELDLSSNLLTEVSFTGVHFKLRALDLSSNNITSVRQIHLENIIHLIELNLANNKIISLPAAAFPGGTFLRTLNLKSNRIVSLEPGCLDSLTSLETLILTRNRLSSFPKGLFKNMKSLIVLELNKNKFVEIQGLTFHGLENLKVLRFKRNQVEFLMDGAFFGLSSIEELSLDRNRVNRVNKGWLYGLTTLRYLSLAQNNIDFVDEDAWEFCKVLTELDLRSNKLQLLDRLTLSRLPSLKTLYLQDNKISHIEGGENDYDSKTFAEVPLLETLLLDGNEISHTIEDMRAPFDGLSNLRTLTLSNNFIKSIGNEAFIGLSSLEELDVRFNVISTVQENAFSALPFLRTIHMDSSSMLCDCYLKWFPKWLNETTTVSSDNVIATCAHPEQLKGQLITYVPYESYTCDDFPKPYILQQPETQITLHGAGLSLKCRAASTSPADMTFVWKIDSDIIDDISDSPDCQGRCIRYQAHSYDGKGRDITSELHLTNLTYDDAGRYQCVVSNRFGATYSERANITVYVYPSFVVTPEDITVEGGASATMKCAAKGVPAPEVFWTKDSGSDFPAATERRIINSFPIGHDQRTTINSFVIRDVKAVDTGMYTCTAKNPAGTVSWNISLSVLESPTFVKPMTDEVVSEGDTAVVECMTSGSPKPTLTWFKDGEQLEPTERHFFAADNQLLIVVKARLTDAGKYECTVENALGRETQSSIVRVKAFSAIIPVKPNSGNPTYGFIILAVVGCVIGTSLVWLIIFACRRRSQSRRRSSVRGMSSDGKDDPELMQAFVERDTRKPLVTSGLHAGGRGVRKSRDFSDTDGGGGRGGRIDLCHKNVDEVDPSFDDASVRLPTETELSFPDSQPFAHHKSQHPHLALAQTHNRVLNLNHDASSERDSGTGDSRKSRDDLASDEAEDAQAGNFRSNRDNLDNSDEIKRGNEALVASFMARQGGGESTMSLTEFEATGMTMVGNSSSNTDDSIPYADDDDEDAEDRGCGEATFSASNSVANSDDENESEVNNERTSKPKSTNEEENDKICDKKENAIENSASDVNEFRTFHPLRAKQEARHRPPSDLSKSRDYLADGDYVNNRRWRRMGGAAKKRASAIELNGVEYLAIEAVEDESSPAKEVIEAKVYRGGLGVSSRASSRLEVDERLLEMSLNSTDYTLHESKLVRNSQGRASVAANGYNPNSSSYYVNSLPRSKNKNGKKYKKLKVKTPTSGLEERSSVALKDREMFT